MLSSNQNRSASPSHERMWVATRSRNHRSWLGITAQPGKSSGAFSSEASVSLSRSLAGSSSSSSERRRVDPAGDLCLREGTVPRRRWPPTPCFPDRSRPLGVGDPHRLADPERPRVQPLLPGDHLQQRGLPDTVRPDHAPRCRSAAGCDGGYSADRHLDALTPWGWKCPHPQAYRALADSRDLLWRVQAAVPQPVNQSGGRRDDQDVLHAETAPTPTVFICPVRQQCAAAGNCALCGCRPIPMPRSGNGSRSTTCSQSSADTRPMPRLRLPQGG